MAERVALDWSSADVNDGTLVVELSDKPPKKWRDAFERATALLSHGTWHTRLNRNGAVRVDPVGLGDEERVRQFLEGALLEANRTTLTEDELFDDSHANSDSEKSEIATDEQLTQTFRAFATP
jgi:hypothetical protein